MSFLKKLFGGGGAAAAPPSKSLEHKGFTVAATPYKEGGQFQACGVVSKDGQEHRFVRADRFSSLEEAAEFSLAKGRQIVDEQGERLFQPRQ